MQTSVFMPASCRLGACHLGVSPYSPAVGEHSFCSPIQFEMTKLALRSRSPCDRIFLCRHIVKFPYHWHQFPSQFAYISGHTFLQNVFTILPLARIYRSDWICRVLLDFRYSIASRSARTLCCALWYIPNRIFADFLFFSRMILPNVVSICTAFRPNVLLS